jgi:hypothetical protein
MEPEYLAQNGEKLSTFERAQWLRSRSHEARAQGCTHFRVSHHQTIMDLVLIEGWRVRPVSEGEPRFALSARQS